MTQVEDIWTSHFSRQEVLFSLIQKYQQEDAKKASAGKGSGGTGGSAKGALKKTTFTSNGSSSTGGVGIKLIGRQPPAAKGSGNIFEITEAPADEENDAASKRRSVTIMSNKGEDGGRISANRESLTDRVPQEVNSPKQQTQESDSRGSKSVDVNRIKYADEFASLVKQTGDSGQNSSGSGTSKQFNLPKGVNVNIFATDKLARGNSSNAKKRKEISPLFGNPPSAATKLAKNKSYASLAYDKPAVGLKTSYSSIRAETLKTPG